MDLSKKILDKITLAKTGIERARQENQSLNQNLVRVDGNIVRVEFEFPEDGIKFTLPIEVKEIDNRENDKDRLEYKRD